MSLFDRINFCIRKWDYGDLTFFISSAKSDEYDLLFYLFERRITKTRKNPDLEFYSELLVEIEQIELGELERNEEAGLVDLGDPGELIIYKDKTILEREEEGKRLEIPTSEFKQLVEDWIKFVEVNMKAFAP